MRPGAEFSNGTPVTGSDVVYSIERSRAFKGGWGFLLTAVKTITATSPSTVVITLSQPHAPLLSDLAMYAYSVLLGLQMLRRAAPQLVPEGGTPQGLHEYVASLIRQAAGIHLPTAA